MCAEMTKDDLHILFTEANRLYLMYVTEPNLPNEKLLQHAVENLDRALSHDIQEKGG